MPISLILLEKPFYPKKNMYEIKKEIFSVILVPTAGIIYNKKENKIEPTKNSINRIKKAIEYTEDIDLPIIISGGITKPDFDSEASVVFKSLKKKYLINKNIILEKKSINSYETSKNLKKYLKENNLNKNIILITDLYHYKRMAKSLEKNNIKPFYIKKIFKKKEISYKNFIPSFKNYSNINNIKYEYFGLIYYKILGRI